MHVEMAVRSLVFTGGLRFDFGFGFVFAVRSFLLLPGVRTLVFEPWIGNFGHHFIVVFYLRVNVLDIL